MNGKDLVSLINADSTKEKFAAALPDHVKPERFARILTTSVMTDDKLRKANPQQLLSEACQVAALGLVTDPQLGEAYLIADHKGGVQRRIGYRGLIKLAHQAGVPTIYAEVVCEHDEFDLQSGTSRGITHKPMLKGDRGEPYLYYAVAIDGDGRVDFDYMTLPEIHRIRDTKSDGWKAYKANKIKSTPWATDEGEMAKKTVLRRLLKRVEMSSDKSELLARALEAEDAAERGAGLKDITPPKAAVGPAKTMDELVGQIAGPDDDRDGPTIHVWLSDDNPKAASVDEDAAFAAIKTAITNRVEDGDAEGAEKILHNNIALIGEFPADRQDEIESLLQKVPA